MTEKLARRGLHVPLDYEPDYLQATPVRAGHDHRGRRSSAPTRRSRDARAPRRRARRTARTRSSTATAAASGSSRAPTCSGPTQPTTRPCRDIASLDVVSVAAGRHAPHRARTHHRRRGRAPPRARRGAARRRACAPAPTSSGPGAHISPPSRASRGGCRRRCRPELTGAGGSGPGAAEHGPGPVRQHLRCFRHEGGHDLRRRLARPSRATPLHPPTPGPARSRPRPRVRGTRRGAPSAHAAQCVFAPVPALRELVGDRPARDPFRPRSPGYEIEDLGEHRVIRARGNDAVPVGVREAGLRCRDEPRAEPDPVGAEHQRGRDARARRRSLPRRPPAPGPPRRRRPARAEASTHGRCGRRLRFPARSPRRLRPPPRRRAPSTLRTWQSTNAPASWAGPTNGVGSANECAMIRTPSSSATRIRSAAPGKWLITPTPNGRSVSSRARRIWRCSHGAPSFVVPPMSPSPPASDTAAASSAGASPPPIGAFRIGYSISSRSQSRVCKVRTVGSSSAVDGLAAERSTAGAGSRHGWNGAWLEPVDEAAHQLEVHAADQLGVLLRERVERAVDEGHRRRRRPAARSRTRRAPRRSRRAAPALGAPRPRVRAAVAPSRCPASRAASRSARPDRDTVALRVGDRAGEQPTRELVVTLGQADRDLTRRAPVELGRPTGAGPTPPRRPRGTRPRAARRRRACRGGTSPRARATPTPAAASSRLTGVRLDHDVAVQGAAHRLAERGDAGDPRVEVVRRSPSHRARVSVAHGHLLTEKLVDEMASRRSNVQITIR